MKLEWKNLPLLDVDLVKFLRQKYPPIEYSPDDGSDGFVEKAIFRAGQRDVIDCLEYIIQLQQKNRGG